MINSRFHLAKDVLELAQNCNSDPSVAASLRDQLRAFNKTYDTLCHSVEKVRQRRTKDEKKENREMEILFRKALQKQWPRHKLALHTTDITKSATDEEASQATTQDIQEILSNEGAPGGYP